MLRGKGALGHSLSLQGSEQRQERSRTRHRLLKESAKKKKKKFKKRALHREVIKAAR